MADDDDEEADILGDLVYVVANPGSFDQEMMVNVIKAAITEIMELRLKLAALDPPGNL